MQHSQLRFRFRSPVAKATVCLAAAALLPVLLQPADAQAASSGMEEALKYDAPRLTGTYPQIGSTNVDPATTTILVQFDRDMGGGMSWTGGGPNFPEGVPGAKPYWPNKRTCVMPVQLRPGTDYRIGINSPSFQNFRSISGTPAGQVLLHFTTSGTPAAAPVAAAPASPVKPKIVSMNPPNGATNVDPSLSAIQVVFDTPMAGGFSWTGGGPNYPVIPDGQRPAWGPDKKTCTLPVKLQPQHDYQLGLNSVSFRNFASEGGIALDPVVYRFRTR